MSAPRDKLPPVRRTKVNHDALARLVADLLHGPATAEDLAEVTGLSVDTVRNVMLAFRRQGAAFVCGHEEPLHGAGGPKRRVFQLGIGKDVKPARSEAAKRAARNRKARRQGASDSSAGV